VTAHGWLLDELIHAGHEHLDPGYVPGYDDKAQTDPREDLEILLAAGLDRSHTLIDFGAGTGTFAIAAAAYCSRVIAIDVSDEMLGVLERKMRETGVENIEPVHAGFLSYDHSGEPADFVYSRHALHHLPDFWKAYALSRISAMLKPGGVFYLRDLVFSFEPGDTETVLDLWLAGAAPSNDRGWTRAELEEHIREEHSTFTWLLEPMLERAGFDIVDVQNRESKIYAAYHCVKR
jgi:ubiquinone/menaquinone biosynthesis C-methylase UbiE